MTGMHRALIVEDDPLFAENLQEILNSLAFESEVVDNKSDAIAVLDRQAVCFILLDLHIKLERLAIRGHVEHGKSLLREIRHRYPDHPGLCYWLPVLIVSGSAPSVAIAVDVIKDGADDLIQKPLVDDGHVSNAIRQALGKSGRSTHEMCIAGPAPRPLGANESIVLSIPGDRVRRRTHVAIGSKVIPLPDRSLEVLLHLMVAHEKGGAVHKTDLGATNDKGFKGISVLRADLNPILGKNVNIITNDYQGHYKLADCVSITECNADQLARIGDREITRLARELQSLLEGRRKV
jgi:ActR/RegA family two-component response regulator